MGFDRGVGALPYDMGRSIFLLGQRFGVIASYVVPTVDRCHITMTRQRGKVPINRPFAWSDMLLYIQKQSANFAGTGFFKLFKRTFNVPRVFYSLVGNVV